MSKNKRGVSPVIGTVLMIGLVFMASVFVAIFINNMEIPNFTLETESPLPQDVKISIINYNISDSDGDGCSLGY